MAIWASVGVSELRHGEAGSLTVLKLWWKRWSAVTKPTIKGGHLPFVFLGCIRVKRTTILTKLVFETV